MGDADVKGGNLGKLYDTLSLEELFRLRIRAWARRDRAECGRLDRAAMLKQYGSYSSRLEASDTLTLSIVVDLLPKLAKLQIIGAVRPMVEYLEGAAQDAAWLGYLDGYAAGWKAAGKGGQPPGVPEKTLTVASRRAYRLENRFSHLLDLLASELASQARTPRDALAGFAEDELGVGLDDLMGAWASPAVAILTEHAEALDAAEADAEGLELLRDVLRLAWRKHGMDDPTADVDDELRARYEDLQRRAHDAAGA